MPNATVSTLTAIVIAVVVGASCLLMSPPQTELPGRQPWSADSLLRAVVEMMALHYQYPTPNGVAVKALALHLGAAVVLGIVTIGAFAATGRRAEADLEPHSPATAGGGSKRRETIRDLIDATEAQLYRRQREYTRAEHAVGGARMLPLAQVGVLGFLAIQLLSTLWSHAPDYTFFDAMLIGIEMAWALAIARCLTLRGAVAGTTALVGVLTAAAVIGVWYHYERSPSNDLAFPLGNPLFLGVVLAPALLLAVTCALGHARARLRGDSGLAVHSGGYPSLPGRWWAVVLLAAAVVPLAWAFSLTHARSSQVALLAGAVAFLFFSTRHVRAERRKAATVFVGVLIVVGAVAGPIWLMRQTEIAAGRSGDSLRGRFYYWRYASQIFRESPVLGSGRGTYALLADAKSHQDRLEDPLAFFQTSVVHAHNEWLQVLAEGGVVSGLLLFGAYGLTLLAGGRALQRDSVPPVARWSLVGLLAGLVVMIVEECADNALRVEDVPPVFYTLLGLAWALIAGIHRADAATTDEADTARSYALPLRLAGLVGGLGASAACLYFGVLNWDGARASFRVRSAFEEVNPDGAVDLAAFGAAHRLDSYRRLEAERNLLIARADTVTHYLTLASQRIQGAQAEPQQAAERMFQAGGNLIRTNEELERAFALAARLQRIAPSAPQIAHQQWRLGDLALRLTPVASQHARALETLRNVPSLSPDARWVIDSMTEIVPTLTAKTDTYRQYVINALERVVQREPFSEEPALVLWQLNPNRPIDDQIRLFLNVLRGGAVGADFLRAAEVLAERDGFDSFMAEWLNQARKAIAGEGDERPESDAFYASVLRLAGQLADRDERFVEAAALLKQSAELYGSRFVPAASAALVEVARIQFQIDPENADVALEIVQRAVELLAPLQLSENALAPYREIALLFRLAAGREDEAKQEIEKLTGNTDPAVLQRYLGDAYAQLAIRFTGRDLDQRPQAYATWVERARALNATSPIVLELRFREAVSQKRGVDAVTILQRALATTGDDSFVDAMLRFGLIQLPDDESLRAYAAQRNVTTQPTAPPSANGIPTISPSLRPPDAP